MNIQLVVVMIAFSIAILLLARKTYLTLSGKKDGRCEKCPGKHQERDVGTYK